MPPQVLIVDDNPAIRHSLLCTIEQNTDWKICGEAEDGALAVEQVKRLHPDVVILDLSMPRMNGIEAARQIREIEPDSYLILFTLYLTPRLAAAAREVGVNEVISKSDAQSLLRALRLSLAA